MSLVQSSAHILAYRRIPIVRPMKAEEAEEGRHSEGQVSHPDTAGTAERMPRSTGHIAAADLLASP